MSLTLYAGFAGDTDPGRFLSAGLWRSREGGAWERAETGFPGPPQTFALLADPARPGEVFAGTQDGIFRSDDWGGSWLRLNAPKPRFAVWSLTRHPHEPETIFAGYEPMAIVKSTDNGATWRDLEVEASYPSIAAVPGQPKRVTRIAVDPQDGKRLYATIEVGGLLMSEDGGASWRQTIDGLYAVEDAVDLHSAVVHRDGAVTVATRVGVFQSHNHGVNWRPLAIPRLREKGTYARVLGLGAEGTLYAGGGTDFDGEQGGFFRSDDGGKTFTTRDLGFVPRSTVFALAVHPASPERLACSDKFGNVWLSDDAGESFRPHPLPKGLGHLFSLALA
ncbi:MAG: hypothetical protein ACOZAM_08110 [Pseudomonadota bacterium]